MVVMYFQNGLRLSQRFVMLSHFFLWDLTADPSEPLAAEADLFDITTVNMRLVSHFTDKLIVALLRDGNVRLSVVFKEHVLVLGIGLDPVLVVGVGKKSILIGCSEVSGLIGQHHLLEVGVIENVGVHHPSGSGTLLQLRHEAESVNTAHQSNEVLGRKVRLSKTTRHQAVVVAFVVVLDSVLVAEDRGAAHLEDHLGATAVLDSGVASKLNQVSVGEHLSDVIATLTESEHLSDSVFQLFGVSNVLLSGDSYGGTSTTQRAISIQEGGVVEGSSKQLRHNWLGVEKIKKGFFGDVI